MPDGSRRSGKNGKKGGQNGLDPADFRLWHAFTQDVKPLDGTIHPENVEEIAPVSEKAKGKGKSKTALPPATLKIPARISPPPVVKEEVPQLDFRTDQKLRRGQMPIDAKLDLHGKTQEQAHTMLNDFIRAAHGRGHRCVLVITGKGRGGQSADDAYAPDLKPGILKQKLPEWLSMSPLRQMVLKITPAQARHGGGGAFYIYLKRTRD